MKMQAKQSSKKPIVLIVTFLTFCLLAGAIQAEPPTAIGKPKIMFSLPDWCNTPDGMTMAPNGDIILACPNLLLEDPALKGSDESFHPQYPALLMSINKRNQIKTFFAMPLHPETLRCGPMGMDFGPDGNLYVADNQYMFNKDHKSRLIRVNIKNNKAISADVVVEGFKLSNAVVWKNNEVFVSDTFMDHPDTPALSAVYRFTLKELNKGVVKLKQFGADSHKIVQLETKKNHRDDVAGADGLTIDSKGNLYIANFGDGSIHKVTFEENGKVKSQSVWIHEPKELGCADGLFADLENDNIYVVNSERNAIQVVSPEGKLSLIWENGDTDGSDGSMDQPAEVILRGDDLITANIDLPMPGLTNTKFDAPHTLSILKIKR